MKRYRKLNKLAMGGYPEDAYSTVIGADPTTGSAINSGLIAKTPTLQTIPVSTGTTLSRPTGSGLSAGAVGGVTALGTGLMDAIDAPNQYGNQSSGVTIGKGALTGAATGATIGSAIPGIGTAIGAAAGAIVGGVTGWIKAGKIKKQERKMYADQNLARRKYDEAVSGALAKDQGLVEGYKGASYYATGGMVTDPPAGYKPLNAAQRSKWNGFVKYLNNEHVGGSADLDNRSNKMGLDYMEKYRKANPDFDITPEQVPFIQYEFQQLKETGGLPGVNMSKKVRPLITAGFGKDRQVSPVDGWIGSLTSQQGYPEVQAFSDDPTKKVWGTDYEGASNYSNTNWRSRATGGYLDRPGPKLNVDSTLQANAKAPFVDRILHAGNYPVRKNPDGSVSTHLMATTSDDTGAFAYPTLRLINGQWVEDKNPRAAVKAGDMIRFKSDADADYFSRNYKTAKSSTLKTSYKNGGRVEKEASINDASPTALLKRSAIDPKSKAGKAMTAQLARPANTKPFAASAPPPPVADQTAGPMTTLRQTMQAQMMKRGDVDRGKTLAKDPKNLSKEARASEVKRLNELGYRGNKLEDLQRQKFVRDSMIVEGNKVNATTANIIRAAIPLPRNAAQLVTKKVFKEARMDKNSMSDEEKLVLWNTMHNAQKRTGKRLGGTEYVDYDGKWGTGQQFNDWFNRGKMGVGEMIGNSLTNPGFKVASTVGRGHYYIDPETGDAVYTDVSDWNKKEKDFKGDNFYQKLRNNMRKTDDPNLTKEKNDKSRMNFIIRKKEIEAIQARDQGVENKAMGGALTRPGTLSSQRTVGGEMKRLNSNGGEVMGPSHSRGGVDFPDMKAQLEGGETTAGNFVFSKELGFAKLHRPIAKAIGRIEKKPQTTDRINALNLLRGREERLALEQESFKAQNGIK